MRKLILASLLFLGCDSNTNQNIYACGQACNAMGQKMMSYSEWWEQLQGGGGNRILRKECVCEGGKSDAPLNQ